MYNDIIFKLGEFSLEAMIYEVSCFPSFGLVSPISNGSHNDMDYFTFVDSSSTLYRYFLEMANNGYSNNSVEDIFAKAREIGKRAEEAMFSKTNGINTHKGMIFVLGLGITATSKILYDQGKFDDISTLIKKMTFGIVKSELQSLKLKENLTHGEKIFLDYGISGVRGEAEDGFSTVFNYALEIYDKNDYTDNNQRLSQTLLAIMSRCEDTTILHRHDYDTLLKLQKNSKQILELGGLTNSNIATHIETFNIHNEKCCISPGGCADLLALTVFFSKIKKTFFNKS
jgi:triphosphoribosyl-dephospho-CoA synthase